MLCKINFLTKSEVPRETPVLESFFGNVVDVCHATFRTPQWMFFRTFGKFCFCKAAKRKFQCQLYTFAVVRIPVKFHKALKKTRYQKQNKKQTGQKTFFM